MTIEQATEEMNQATAALAIAQQHLLEAAAEATQNLSDIRKILGIETPAMRLAPDVKKLRLPDVSSAMPPEKKERKSAGRGPTKSVEDYQKELDELEKIENPTKAQTARKAQVRWLLKKKQPLESPAELIREADPKPEAPTVEIKNKPSLSDCDTGSQVTDRYKVLVHEDGFWKVAKVCSKDEAEATLTRLTFDGFEARIKRIQQ